MTIPEQLRYTKDHEWVHRPDCEPATIGVTAAAADALGEIVYIDLPRVGQALTAGDPCGEVESTKSVSDIYAPASGEVTEVNQAVLDDSGLVNRDPYGDGWLFRMRITGEPELLTAAEYARFADGEEGGDQ